MSSWLTHYALVSEPKCGGVGVVGSQPQSMYTELRPLLSGVHSVMRVKSVLAGEGGGARPPPLITFTLTSKVAVYAPAVQMEHK